MRRNPGFARVYSCLYVCYQHARDETEVLSNRRDVRGDKRRKEKETVFGTREQKGKKERESGSGAHKSEADPSGGVNLEDRIAMMERKIDR